MAGRFPNINRSKVYEDIVQRLAAQHLPGVDRRLFPTIRELLCFAAVLGYSENRKVPLDRTLGVEDISYQQFEAEPEAEGLVYLLALADMQDTNVLREDNEDECVRIFEEYANGGLGIVKDYLLRDGGEYPDRALMRLLRERGYLVVQAEPDTGAIAF